MNTGNIERAQHRCSTADALLVTSGAGMGVDSGLPDFRGKQGFWNAYPAYEKLGVDFVEMANPEHFAHAPEMGWGFYGHRRNLYRATPPHAGFHALLRFGRNLPHSYFSFTSNVDGHFQRAGFADDRVLECHGSIEHLQCTANCRHKVWPAGDDEIRIDASTMRADKRSLPHCTDCGDLARPNILMFGDWSWNGSRSKGQEGNYRHWLKRLVEKRARLVILEFGAGTAVPTVRRQSESILDTIPNSTLVRVNPRESDVPPAGIGLKMGAFEAIQKILPPQ